MISQSIHRILNGRQPLLYDLGDQTRCFTYVDDAIVGFLLAPRAARQSVKVTLSISRSRSRMSTRCLGAEAIDTAARYGGSEPYLRARRRDFRPTCRSRVIALAPCRLGS